MAFLGFLAVVEVQLLHVAGQLLPFEGLVQLQLLLGYFHCVGRPLLHLSLLDKDPLVDLLYLQLHGPYVKLRTLLMRVVLKLKAAAWPVEAAGGYPFVRHVQKLPQIGGQL